MWFEDPLKAVIGGTIALVVGFSLVAVTVGILSNLL